jgi:transcriptional regulator with XRE-family HTH domain
VSREQSAGSESGGVGSESGKRMNDVVAGIGPKIRHLRQQKGLSLQRLAERSGVSPAAIHKVERNGMIPTIATLMKIASALNRPVGYFVDEAQDTKPAVFTPAKERRPVFTSKEGLELGGITGSYGHFFIAGAVAEVAAEASSGEQPMEHPGEELVHVLAGTLLFEVDGQEFKLAGGDSLHFRTDRPHRWRNPASRAARAVWVAMRSR